MCIPHGATRSKDSGFIKLKIKKSIKRVSQEQFEHGDPDFIDERTSVYKSKKSNNK